VGVVIFHLYQLLRLDTALSQQLLPNVIERLFERAIVKIRRDGMRKIKLTRHQGSDDSEVPNRILNTANADRALAVLLEILGKSVQKLPLQPITRAKQDGPMRRGSGPGLNFSRYFDCSLTTFQLRAQRLGVAPDRRKIRPVVCWLVTAGLWRRDCTSVNEPILSCACRTRAGRELYNFTRPRIVDRPGEHSPDFISSMLPTFRSPSLLSGLAPGTASVGRSE
jgi:hypothetical protein